MGNWCYGVVYDTEYHRNYIREIYFYKGGPTGSSDIKIGEFFRFFRTIWQDLRCQRKHKIDFIQMKDEIWTFKNEVRVKCLKI